MQNTCSLLGALLSLSFFLPATLWSQATGTVEGRVALTQNLRESSEIASRQIIRQYSVTSGKFGDAINDAVETPPAIVVYLKSNSATSPVAPRSQPYVIMDQKDERFVPHVLAIERNTEVRFLNSDSIYHNVFSLSQAKSFDLGRYPQGKFRAVKFDKAGLVKVYCDIHTHMSAYILVLDTPYFAMTNDDGTFSLAGVPPGEYQLFAWYGRWQSRPISVKINAAQVTIAELTFP